MKLLYKALAVIVALFFIVLFSTLTVTFIKKAWFSSSALHKEHVTVLELNGILYSAQNQIRWIEEIIDNPGTKALVVSVNSPGGLAAPSQELFEALKKADKKFPVVISMGPLAASGGFYLSLGGRKIFANPATLTASIGVIIEFVNTQELYRWAKIERYSIVTGKFKDTGSPFRPMKSEERELLLSLANEILSQFRSAIKERRGLTDEELINVADGRVMTGSQALHAKLIDQLGGIQDAIDEAKKIAGLDPDAPVWPFETEKGLLKKILLGDDTKWGENLFENFLLQFEKTSFSPGWKVLLLSPVR